MTVSLHTKPRKAATVAPSTGLLVLQPPRHLFIEPHLLTPGEHHIGSAEHCDLVLNVAGISAEHAVLTVTAQQIQLQALSGALTWVNDFPVAQANLRRGDRISFGPLTWTLRAATSDDLLSHLPAQVSEPAGPLPAEEPASSAMLDTLDATLAQIEVVQSPVAPTPTVEDVIAAEEPEESPVEETAAKISVTPIAENATAVDDRHSHESVSVVDDAPAAVAELPQPVWPSPADIADQIAALQAEQAALEEELRVAQNELAVRRASLEEREARIHSWEDRLIAREQIFDQRQTELEAQRTALDHRETALTEERLRLEQVASSAQAVLATEVEKQTAAWSDWETTQRRLSAELNAEFTALHEVEALCNAAKSQFASDQATWKETYAAWQQEHAEWEARRQEQQQQLAQWEAEAQQLRDELAREREQLAEQRVDLQAEACQRSSAHRELLESRQEVLRERRLLAEQQSVWMADREAEWVELRERRRRLDADEREIAEMRRNAEVTFAEAEAARQAVANLPVVNVNNDCPSDDSAAHTDSLCDVTPVDVASVEDLASELCAAESPSTIEEPAPVAETSEASVDEISQLEPLAPETDEVAMRDWMESSFDDLPPAVEAQSAVESTPELTVSVTPLEAALEVEAGVSLTESLTADTLASPEEATLIQSAERFHQEWLQQSFDDEAVAETDAVPPEELPVVEAISDDVPEAEHASEAVAEEPQSEDSLHAQLAKMFGLPEDFGHQTDGESAIPHDPPGLLDTTDSIAMLDSEAGTESDQGSVEEESAAADSHEDDEDEAWRTQLAQMLTEKTAPVTPASVAPVEASAVSEKPQPAAPPPPSPTPPPPPPEEDSIAAYMERLLARNKMGTFIGESPASAPASKPASIAAPPVTAPPVETTSPSLSSGTDSEVVAATPAVSLPLPEPRQRIDKDEVRAALQSFRKVANHSARSAIAKHSSKTLRGEVSTQGVLAGLAGLAAGAYFLPPLWGGTMQPLPGAGCLIAAGWMVWQMQQSLTRLKNWNPNDRLEIDETSIPVEDDRAAPPHRTDEESLSPSGSIDATETMDSQGEESDNNAPQ